MSTIKVGLSIHRNIWSKFKDYTDKNNMAKSAIIEGMLLKFLQDFEPQTLEIFKIVEKIQPFTNYEPIQIINRINRFLYHPTLAIQSIFGSSKWVTIKSSKNHIALRFTQPYDYFKKVLEGCKGSREEIKKLISKHVETKIKPGENTCKVLKRLFEED